MLTIVSSATVTALNIHTSIVFLTKGLGRSLKDNLNKLLALNLAWTVLAVLWLIIIAASCEMSNKEAGRAVVFVQKLSLHRNVDFGILKELQLFSSNFLVLMSALQFFALDFSFLYSTHGFIAPFIVFLTQVWESLSLSLSHTHTHTHTHARARARQASDYIRLIKFWHSKLGLTRSTF
jgi:hypothetical protein